MSVKKNVLFLLFLFFLSPYSIEAFQQEKDFARPLIDTPGKTIGSDFNGDGIHDFIVGALGYADEGGAYVFFGANNLSGTFEHTLSCQGATL